jgi:thiamine pyrophosphokinase
MVLASPHSRGSWRAGPVSPVMSSVHTRSAPATHHQHHYHHTSSFLSTVSPLNIALVVLNIDRSPLTADRFSHLWAHSSLHICADGAANKLHDSLGESARAQMLPDLITGDLDSLRKDVHGYYADRGVSVQGESEQDTHDFEKCLRWLERQQRQPTSRVPEAYPKRYQDGRHADAGGIDLSGTRAGALPQSLPEDGRISVVAYGAFGGRLDQQMANLNMAYAFSCFAHLYLVSDESVAFVLRPGSHVIERNPDVEDGSCGLIPLGGRCDGVVTTGLRWDLDGTRPLEFGALISSSNEMVDSTILVETQAPILWTAGLRAGT